MGRKCSVPDCGSNYESRLRLGGHATSTFKFPDDPEIRNQWVAVVGRPNGWVPKKTSCICMNHFRPDDFEKLSKPAKLKPDAVPTLFGSEKADYEPVGKPSGPPDELKIDFESLYARVLEKADFVGWHFYRKKNILHFYNVDDADRTKAIQIINSIKVFNDMSVNVFAKEIKQSDAVIKRVLGRDLKICRWSQFEAILKKYELKNSPESEDSSDKHKTQEMKNDTHMVVIPSSEIKAEPCEESDLHEEAELDMDIVKEETTIACSDEDSDREDAPELPEEKKNMYETLRLLSEAKHKCFICDLEHETNDKYQYHLTTHMDMLPYECNRCVTEKVLIQSLPTLNKHFLMHLKPLKCRTCDARFTTYKARSIHEKSFHAAAESVSCEICGETFLSQKRYNKHLKNHTKIDEVSCKICDKHLNTAYDLDLHMKSQHPTSASFNYEELATVDPNVKVDFNVPLENASKKPTKDYFCIECNKQLPNTSSYYSHMQGHRKQFQCGYCGVRIARRRDFRDHENTHTGKRPYECNICNMRFMAASTYYGHRATHKGEKKFACEICGRTFSRKEHMVSHANIHKKLNRRGRRTDKETAKSEAQERNEEGPIAMNTSIGEEADSNRTSSKDESATTEMES